ncbi:MAG: hypothetical protein DRP71_03585 [Verrucomicrobia bacterium]|nr:MAG: hypothetical protein DRP71_03585 [Verrucomicrobiota bacterium]
MRLRSLVLMVVLAALAGGRADAQKRIRPPPQYKTWGEPDQAKGLEILQAFRNSGLAGDYLLNFSLQTYGADREKFRVAGTLYGSRSRNGPISLIEINEPSGSGRSVRYLIQSGPEPYVWRADEEDEIPVLLAGGDLAQTLFGTDVTPFDLQLPYLFWEDFTYEGQVRFRGRPTNVFLLFPPEREGGLYPGITGVRLYLDSQFNAMMQAEILNEALEIVKKINLLEIKKIDGQWMAKAIDVRMPDGVKTRFRIESASMSCAWDPALFEPAKLYQDLPRLEESRLTVVR